MKKILGILIALLLVLAPFKAAALNLQLLEDTPIVIYEDDDDEDYDDDEYDDEDYEDDEDIDMSESDYDDLYEDSVTALEGGLDSFDTATEKDEVVEYECEGTKSNALTHTVYFAVGVLVGFGLNLITLLLTKCKCSCKCDQKEEKEEKKTKKKNDK